jgi:hypothetical protein
MAQPMIDAVSIAVGCASAGTLAWFLECVVFKEKPIVNRKALIEAVEMKKEILERERRSLQVLDKKTGFLPVANSARCKEIDRELMRLADEKAKIA